MADCTASTKAASSDGVQWPFITPGSRTFFHLSMTTYMRSLPGEMFWRASEIGAISVQYMYTTLSYYPWKRSVIEITTRPKSTRKSREIMRSAGGEHRRVKPGGNHSHRWLFAALANLPAPGNHERNPVERIRTADKGVPTRTEQLHKKSRKGEEIHKYGNWTWNPSLQSLAASSTTAFF